jgi:hypothetical protein
VETSTFASSVRDGALTTQSASSRGSESGAPHLRSQWDTDDETDNISDKKRRKERAKRVKEEKKEKKAKEPVQEKEEMEVIELPEIQPMLLAQPRFSVNTVMKEVSTAQMRAGEQFEVRLSVDASIN